MLKCLQYLISILMKYFHYIISSGYGYNRLNYVRKKYLDYLFIDSTNYKRISIPIGLIIEYYSHRLLKNLNDSQTLSCRTVLSALSVRLNRDQAWKCSAIYFCLKQNILNYIDNYNRRLGYKFHNLLSIFPTHGLGCVLVI